jgi:hypothetical protein
MKISCLEASPLLLRNESQRFVETGLPERVSSPSHIYYVSKTSTAEVDCALPYRAAKKRTFHSSLRATVYQPTPKSQIRKQVEHEVENDQTEPRGQKCENRAAWRLGLIQQSTAI